MTDVKGLAVDADAKWLLAVGVILVVSPLMLPAPSQKFANGITAFSAFTIVLLTFLSPVVCGGLVALVFLRSRLRDGAYASALRLPRPKLLVSLFLIGTFTSVLTARLDLWPWIWMAPGYTTREFSRFAMGNDQYLGIALWLVIAVAVVPLVEESVFRFGFLRVVAKSAGDAYLAALASGIFFGVLHFSLNVNRVTVLNMLGTAILGACAGLVTVKMNGNIWGAVVLHSSRNTSELIDLILHSNSTF